LRSRSKDHHLQLSAAMKPSNGNFQRYVTFVFCYLAFLGNVSAKSKIQIPPSTDLVCHPCYSDFLCAVLDASSATQIHFRYSSWAVDFIFKSNYRFLSINPIPTVAELECH
jgi:hypothetical protein